MKVFRHTADVPDAFKGAVVAIGNFDGVHLGHQALIARTLKLAEDRKAPAAVLTFEPSPREFFRPGGEPFKLTPFRNKCHLISTLGVDCMYALPFDAEMAHRTAQEFAFEVLIRGLEAGCVVVGSDFRFGMGRAGDAAMLSYLGDMEGFGVSILETIKLPVGEKISSTGIREALKAGRPHEAMRWMGHPFTIEGRVHHGEERGRTLGYPTANMHLDGYIRPAFGIYAVRVSVLQDDEIVARYNGVANLGVRPMYLLREPLLETHLFDFDGDVYGMHLAVELISFIRPEAVFATPDELKVQIAEDVEKARAVLSR